MSERCKNSYNLRSKSKKNNLDIPSGDFSRPPQDEPNVTDMFEKFNKTYFWGRLAGVKLEFSMRLKQSAGVCVYRPKVNFCCIRLSSPLLKLRPQNDLIDTLLHEMIHAFLFITKTPDEGSHGPEFRKHMDRINKKAGTNITVYHTFHSEVKLYQQHWWRCNGPCRMWPPFFGMVKRSMNRAPGPSDSWWQNHVTTCGGVYTKVREPIEYTQRREKGLFGFKKPETSDNPSDGKVPSRKYGLENITGYVDLTFPSQDLGSTSGYIDLTTPSKISSSSVSSQPCPICAVNITGNLSVHVTECLNSSGLLSGLNEFIPPFENNFCGKLSHCERPTSNSQNLCPVCGVEVKNDMISHLEDKCLNASGILDDQFEFKNSESIEIPSDSSNFQVSDNNNYDKEINICPICSLEVKNNIQNHVDECLNNSDIFNDLLIQVDCDSFEHTSAVTTEVPSVSTNSQSTDSNNVCKLTNTCPVCSLEVNNDLQTHVDECLSNSGLFNDSDLKK